MKICYFGIFDPDYARNRIIIKGFQENGYEGAIPPAQNTNRKLINVSFGGTGSGPTQFIRPSAIAFFDQILYLIIPFVHQNAYLNYSVLIFYVELACCDCRYDFLSMSR